MPLKNVPVELRLYWLAQCDFYDNSGKNNNKPVPLCINFIQIYDVYLYNELYVR